MNVETMRDKLFSKVIVDEIYKDLICHSHVVNLAALDRKNMES